MAKDMSSLKWRLKAIFVCLLLVYACFTTHNAHSDEAKYAKGDTVLGLLEECRVTNPTVLKEMFGQIRCQGYIAGLRDALLAKGIVTYGSQGFGVCNVPRNLPVDAFVQIFVNWAQKHPEEWSEHMSHAVTALVEQWPCP